MEGSKHLFFLSGRTYECLFFFCYFFFRVGRLQPKGRSFGSWQPGVLDPSSSLSFGLAKFFFFFGYLIIGSQEATLSYDTKKNNSKEKSQFGLRDC